MRFCIILPNHRVAFAMTNPIPLTKIPLFAGLGRDETTYLTSLLKQRNTVEKLRGIRNLNEIMAETLTPWQKLSNSIAAMAASQAFLMTHAIAFGAWIAINLLLPKKNAPDPFPFPFLCFWTSCEAIF